MRISDWSSDVCSSDLPLARRFPACYQLCRALGRESVDMQDILQRLEEMRAQAAIGGGQTRIDPQHAQGQLTARARLQVLLEHPKSLVWGRRGSERAGLGCGGIQTTKRTNRELY